jgi:asparagine N-glycosylation enzyme membrane subunit Stt3
MKKESFFIFMPWLICGIITLAVGIYFRLYPLTHNVASDEYEQATMLVLTKVRATITEQVNARFPHMSAEEKQRLIQTQFNALVRKDNARLRQAFNQVGQQFIKETGEKKHYLQESDSYYFLDLTQNILDRGDVSTKVEGSQYFNDKMLAPVGYWEPQTWHPYIGAWVYKASKAFNPGIDLMTGLGFTPLALFPLVLAAFLMACRGLGCGWPSAFTASMFFILAPIYLQRSTYGWYDNDTYSVLFPVLNLGLLFFALRSVDDLKKMIFWGVLAGLSFGLYARFWTGWGFSWGISLTALGCIAVRAFILKETGRRNLALLLATIAGTTLFFLVVSIGIKQFLELFPFAYGELKKFTMSEFKGWPDLFIVVGELHAATLSEAVKLSGGPIVSLGALATFIAVTRRSIQKRQSPPDHIILLVLFTAITLLLGLSAERFTILLITPLCLVFAYGLEMLWQARAGIGVKIKVSSRVIQTAILAGFMIMALFPVAASQKEISGMLHPIFNSAWDRALSQLREKSPADSVINTWWSPGHFVKAIAKRRVTFDGASIKGEQAYWLTHVYLSQNENEALGILRMLNTSSNQAAEFLQKHGWPLSRATAMLTDITVLSRKEASARLSKVLSSEEIKGLLELTHGTPPPSYMLIYNEIVEGNVLLGYVGKWDFARIEALNRNPGELRKVPRKSSRDYIDFLWSLVGGPLRQSETLNPLGKKDGKILFDQGVIIDTADMSATINSSKFGHGVPLSLVYLDEATNRVVEKKSDKGNLSYSLVFFKDNNNTPRCVLMDRLLANALIMKLYYFDGKGLDHFKLFAKEQDITGRTKIFVYQVDWPKSYL